MSKNFYVIIIAVLTAIILLQHACNKPKTVTVPGTSTVTTDTVWRTKDTVIVKKVTLVKRDTVYRPGDRVFIADTNCDKLKIQFETLAKEFSVRNIHLDTFYLDSLGKVIVTDTVQYNKIRQRSYNLTYRIPVVTKTITHIQAPRRQLYLGGGMSMTTTFQNPTLQVGLLYKNKKDQLFGAYTLWNGYAPQVGLSAYWKISLRK